MPPESLPENLIAVAQVLRPHGIRGAMKVKSFTNPPEQVLDYCPLLTAEGLVVRLKLQAMQGDVLLVSCDGVADRTAAEAWSGCQLFVDRDQLPQLAAEGEEFYWADLIGLRVVDQAEQPLGQVTGVENYGAGDLLTIRWLSPQEPRLKSVANMAIPFSKAWVPVVNLAAGWLMLQLPEPAGASAPKPAPEPAPEPDPESSAD
ncbi:MAG: 16S rRNA processing protein RimM [Alphaproteobacteria bacterium]|nr:16S rRNA processing protein RimM [Alphaproteobacteria bacterium]